MVVPLHAIRSLYRHNVNNDVLSINNSSWFHGFFGLNALGLNNPNNKERTNRPQLLLLALPPASSI